MTGFPSPFSNAVIQTSHENQGMETQLVRGKSQEMVGNSWEDL